MQHFFKIYKILIEGSYSRWGNMRTRIKLKLINKLFLFIFIFLFSALASQAANSLSGVDVKQSENGSYNVILSMNNTSTVKKISESKDNLTLVLDSMLPSESLEIIYDNASELQNVMIQKKNQDTTMVILQGKNIESANIYTKDFSTGVIKPVNNGLSSLNNYLYVANVKYLTFALIGIIFAFFFMISSRPKQSKDIQNVKKQYKTIKNTTINKLSKKAAYTKRYVPSINYRITGLEPSVTVPHDFVISNEMKYINEEIKKAG